MVPVLAFKAFLADVEVLRSVLADSFSRLDDLARAALESPA